MSPPPPPPLTLDLTPPNKRRKRQSVFSQHLRIYMKQNANMLRWQNDREKMSALELQLPAPQFLPKYFANI